jgi:hypothetical protein
MNDHQLKKVQIRRNGGKLAKQKKSSLPLELKESGIRKTRRKNHLV